MIPRYQRILFWALLLASVAMAAVLIRLRERAADRISGHDAADSANLSQTAEAPSPAPAPEETVTLLESSDADGAIAPVTRQIALPKETGARARVLLRQLLADYAAPGSKHPLSAGRGADAGIEEVFFMPAPEEQKSNRAGPGGGGEGGAGQTAIVNFTAGFADYHPSGIEPETLTLLSIIGTLHQNFPAVERVRFLIDGQPRQTLAGHADLTRAYLAGDAEGRP